MEYKQTEEYALEKEAQKKAWQEEYGKKWPEIKAWMNRLLIEKSTENLAELEAFFTNKENYDHYGNAIYMKMYTVMCIHKVEMRNGIFGGIISQGESVEELTGYLDEIKFLLYRLDFSIDTETEQEFVDFIRERATSVVTLMYMINQMTMRPLNLIVKLEQIFEKYQMYKERFWTWQFIAEKWPGNIKIERQLANLYFINGQKDKANEILGRIQTYGIKEEINEEINEEDANPLRELFWRWRYMDKMALTTIVKMASEGRITPQKYGILLEQSLYMKQDGYILLAEALEKRGLEQYALISLEVGMEKLKRIQKEY